MSLLQELSRQLKSDEGLKLHAYTDTKGFLTIGYGRLIDKRRGGGLSQEEAEYLLSNDIAKRRATLTIMLPWMFQLDEARQGVLLNMSFQMGVDGLMGFKKMLAACRDGRWAEAAEQMRQSQWAKETPERCKRLAHQMEMGLWQ